MNNKLFNIARINKDKNFDGKFFFAVSSTKIFCRPSCPSPVAKEENVTYYNNIYEALTNDYRPCLRCRPDIDTEQITSNIDGQNIVKKAINMISQGFLNTHSVADLAKELHLSDRHLRKLFVKELGCPPIQIAKYSKGIFAKKLLLNSKMTITDIAFKSGFGSIRQFNNTFKNMFGVAPSKYRKEYSKSNIAGKTLLIPYKLGFEFKDVLDFMSKRIISGVENVTNNEYSRTFNLEGNNGYFTVKDNTEKSSLELEVFSENMNVFMTVYYSVRRMFDLDTDFESVYEILSKDEILKKGIKNSLVPRLPVAFEPYEFTIRAILGQQITIKAATTLAGRIAKKADIKIDTKVDGLTHIFPSPEIIQDLDLVGLGITNIRVRTIKSVTEALLEDVFNLSTNQSFDEFYNSFTSIKGIGDWTANYVAMRGLGMVDAFPAGDLGVINALNKDNEKITIKEIVEIAEKWRPYRTYATLCLWKGL